MQTLLHHKSIYILRAQMTTEREIVKSQYIYTVEDFAMQK